MKGRIATLLLAAIFTGPGYWAVAHAQNAAEQAQVPANSIENLEVAQQGGAVYVKLTMQQPLAAAPASFSVANPARIAFDFPATANALGRSAQAINAGDLVSANIVQAGDRTRLVLNLSRMAPYETRLDGNALIITLSPIPQEAVVQATAEQPIANFAASSSAAALASKSIRDVNFRRGKEGEGRVMVELSSPDTPIDIRKQGPNLIVEFIKTSLPEHLRRRSDVVDFGTPVSAITAQQQGDNVRLVVTPSGLWEHNAYQSDNMFVLEVKRVTEDPNKLVQGTPRGQYGGERLSLNFQNIDVRAVLQVIADFTDFNIITSDSVSGNLTLRLKDVPWDQALDIILQSKGLDMRKNGNVIWIAPSDELATREKLQLEALAQIGDLEPLQTESFQINYHRAKEIYDFLKSKDQTILSKRGSVVVDDRSNKIFVTDVASRLGDLRRLIGEIDLAPKQVLIEARIVEANKDFVRDLGVRMSFTDNAAVNLGGGTRLGMGQIPGVGGALTGTGAQSGGATPVASFSTLNLALFNSAATRFLNLELSALETDGRGKIVSSPRVLTANQVEAAIEQGTEIAYRKETSSGATSVEFKKAVLSLKVKPMITPDGRLQLQVEVNKDSPVFPAGFLEPAIDTKNVKTEVLVENGGTVVIGGIYEESETNNVGRVPVLGEIPVLGALFRNTKRETSRRELLVFITPRIVSDVLTLR
ncbi:type IV pilus secretin PilQ [Thauera sp. CAU 1555]|uniref:Type IV pilus biogenesis and competence protein PilQ n=1 Tax=Thauera sedimentorum TaxID=2767595 RepID=A0ABR9BDH5_9RHOO|nr:type IV pilus secretin PilQ [Thauera sedimentorum]MBC9072578.1 type IV pilus secretin PilQ [Thauera sedimentorum]MBD8503497.1 type IV pilus secretin PilQ [Thauera sedimentorum]